MQDAYAQALWKVVSEGVVPKKAINAYKAALDINPVLFWPWYNLGVGAYKKGNYSQAIEIFAYFLPYKLRILSDSPCKNQNIQTI